MNESATGAFRTEPVLVYDILLCLRATYDWSEPGQPYSLHNVAFQLRPNPGAGYPLLETDLWVFVRLEGDGEQEFWVEVVRLTGDDDHEDEFVAAYGPYLVPFGDERRTFCRAWCLRRIPFPAPGLYEFRFVQGDEILAIESISLED